jgi:hypothetical protein
MTKDDRRRIISYTGICLHVDCVAHDAIIEKILELEARARENS